MFTPRVFHIVDQDLSTVGGHFYAQADSISAACLKRGIQVKIYGRVGTNLSINGVSVQGVFRFSGGVEPTPENEIFAVFGTYFLVNRAFFEDLSLLQRSEFSQDDLVYFPGLVQNQIEAVADWGVTFPAEMRPNLAITLRYSNSKMNHNVARGHTAGIEFLYRHSLARLVERYPRAYLFSDTPALSSLYQQISGIPVIPLPVPQHTAAPDQIQETKIHKNELSILFIGTMYQTRGSSHILRIVELTLNNFNNVNFVIQINDPTEETAASIMKDISEVHRSRTHFLLGSLSIDDYNNALSTSDIVMLPCAPNNYVFNSSGVFTEAAALGKVIVTTIGTTLEASASTYNLGFTVASAFTAESFAEALNGAIVNFSELSEKAKLSKIRFSKENSSESFLHKMFERMT